MNPFPLHHLKVLGIGSSKTFFDKAKPTFMNRKSNLTPKFANFDELIFARLGSFSEERIDPHRNASRKVCRPTQLQCRNIFGRDKTDNFTFFRCQIERLFLESIKLMKK